MTQKQRGANFFNGSRCHPCHRWLQRKPFKPHEGQLSELPQFYDIYASSPYFIALVAIYFEYESNAIGTATFLVV